jgi:hypothetical protein
VTRVYDKRLSEDEGEGSEENEENELEELQTEKTSIFFVFPLTFISVTYWVVPRLNIEID